MPIIFYDKTTIFQSPLTCHPSLSSSLCWISCPSWSVCYICPKLELSGYHVPKFQQVILFGLLVTYVRQCSHCNSQSITMEYMSVPYIITSLLCSMIFLLHVFFQYIIKLTFSFHLIWFATSISLWNVMIFTHNTLCTFKVNPIILKNGLSLFPCPLCIQYTFLTSKVHLFF